MRVMDQDVTFNVFNAMKFPTENEECFKVEMVDNVVNYELDRFLRSDALEKALLGNSESEDDEEFGACQNAVTSSDKTVYELFVPVDKPEVLPQAISILVEFSSEIRVSSDDLEKERGAVLEEYRGTRNANGRMQEAHWALMMEGSKYAEHLPIGLEKMIRTVSPGTVKQFYRKWYHLKNMVIVAIGDFADTQV
ncbi:hypothetical protein AgCh_015956 [Apium graveolens]